MLREKKQFLRNCRKKWHRIFYAKNDYAIRPHAEALIITSIYGFFGLLWIILSDKLLSLIVTDIELYKQIQTYKGWVYVVITVVIVYALVQKRSIVLQSVLNQLQDLNASLEEEISEKITAEESLKKAQNVAHLGNWTWDVVNNIVQWSDGMYDIFGIEKNRVSGKLNDAISKVIHPDDLGLLLPANASLFLEMKPIEYRIIWADHSIHYIWSKAGDAVVDESGKPVFLSGICQDVTERKVIEDAKKNAEAANDAKRTFLANMSHEIRTPINAIIGFNYLIEKTKLTEVQRNYVEKTILSAKNLLELVNDILDFSKIEANKVDLEEIEFELMEVVNSVSSIVSTDLHIKKLRLSNEIDPTIPKVLKGDAFKLSQVLLNLVNNSVKFTEQGEVAIVIEVESKNDQYIVLKFIIKDTGIGMSEDQQSNLFIAFSQVDMSTTRKYGGTGLGLSISKSLVELMGGNISVKSQLGIGSQFTFTCKFEWNDAYKMGKLVDVENSSEEISEKLFKNIRILLVEDNELNQELAKAILEEYGFIISIANNGSEALHMVQRESFELILMDLQMPVMDGYEATRKMREMDDLQPVPIIAMSAHAMKGIKEKVCEAGMNDYIMKPFDVNKMLSIIKKWVLKKN